MSADNGIYILRSKTHEGQFEYRIAHCQAIDNIDWPKHEAEMRIDYFGKSEIILDEKAAWKMAEELHDKYIEEYGFVEYGYSMVEDDIPFPTIEDTDNTNWYKEQMAKSNKVKNVTVKKGNHIHIVEGSPFTIDNIKETFNISKDNEIGYFHLLTVNGIEIFFDPNCHSYLSDYSFCHLSPDTLPSILKMIEWNQVYSLDISFEGKTVSLICNKEGKLELWDENALMKKIKDD